MPIYQKGTGGNPAFIPIMIWNEIPTGTINGVNTIFTLEYTPFADSDMLAEVNLGIMNNPDDYSVSGSTITFVTAHPTGSIIKVTYKTL